VERVSWFLKIIGNLTRYNDTMESFRHMQAEPYTRLAARLTKEGDKIQDDGSTDTVLLLQMNEGTALFLSTGFSNKDIPCSVRRGIITQELRQNMVT